MNTEGTRFQQLDEATRDRLGGIYKDATETAFRESRFASWELAKFLFAANGGAAAGLFVLVRGTPGDGFLVSGFFTFCAGVFFVGAAYFVGTWGFNRNALAWDADLQDTLSGKLSVEELSRRQRSRVRGPWSKLVPLFGTLSFVCLCLGGIIAVKPFLHSSPPSIAPASPALKP